MQPFPYATTTLATAKQQLANRLNDSLFTFWTSAELGNYLIEALRTFQAFTASFRDRVDATLPLPNQAGQQFYDLTDIATDLAGRSVTDQDLITDICYGMIEPPIAWPPAFALNNPISVWAGTDMFTLDDLAQAIQRRRDQFLLETGVVVSHRVVNAPSTPIGRVVLPTVVAAVRRAAWVGLNASGVALPAVNLWREDAWMFNAFAQGWAVNPGTPEAYSVVTPPPVQIQLSPIPRDIGTVDLLTLEIGAGLNPSVTASILGIPDDWAWIVKFGALADLLGRDGQGRDPDRAAYCQQRWADGLTLARLASRVLQVELNGLPVPTPSVEDLDAWNAGWQGPAGIPAGVGLAGLNLLAVVPIPDGNGPYSIVLDVVRQAPVPFLDTDFLQVGAEALDVVLDYAQHLAAFKMGGMEFQATYAHYKRLIDYAKLQNERIRHASFFATVLGDQGKREAKDRQDRDQPVNQPLGFVGTEV